MKKAIWNNQVLAESNATIKIEGNDYFPPDSIKKAYFKESIHDSVCPWKGNASYYTIEVDGKVNENAAWYYPRPKEAAKAIAGYVAFWNGVEISDI